ncbi:MAG: S8 family serine peptidase [Thermoleophilaceae bacterium]
MALAVGAVGAPPASAAESAWPTAQATAYNFAFVPYLDPPPTHAAVCLVDSGVNVTPDTPADSPDGPIVKRLALDGGTGEAAGPSWEQMHGTRMAMVAGAPMNDWGTVGAWPGVRIVSIRAIPAGEASFPFDDYRRAIALCGKWAPSYRVVATNLSLSCECEATADEKRRLQDQVIAAHAADISVIASAGNDHASIETPAAEPGVIAVGAGGIDGQLCSFSNRGAQLGAIASGCGMELADPTTGALWTSYQGGTSAAAATTAATLALLRAYQPELSWDQAEHALFTSLRATTDGGLLDVAATFEAAGLGEQVAEASARIPKVVRREVGEVPPAPELAAGAASGSPASTTIYRVPRRSARQPRITRVIWSHGRLGVTVGNKPRTARLTVIAQARRSEFAYRTLAQATTHRRTITIGLRARPDRIGVRFDRTAPIASPAFRFRTVS